MSVNGLLFRYFCARGDKKRDRGLETPSDIERFDNILYGRCNQQLDLYRPKGYKKPLPLIISVHGGGWIYGDKNVYQFYCMSLAQRGFAVLNFTYRLAPKNKFPAQIEDVDDAVHWAMENGNSYDFDCNNIFLVGDSAGAHLAAMYSCICTNPDYAKQYPTVSPPEKFVARGLGLHCGLYDVSGIEHSAKMLAPMLEDVFGKRNDDIDQKISPARHITKYFPRVFFMSANKDIFLYQLPVLQSVLEENKIPYECHLYGSEEKPLGHVFHCNIREPEAKKCNDELCTFFRKNIIKGKDVIE